MNENTGHPGPALSKLSADSTPAVGLPDLYGPLIGSWSVESTWVTADGKQRVGSGEWHFERVLGGMGVQDVLFAAGAEPREYGSTLRVVDPRTGRWYMVWLQPGSGEFVSLIGHPGDDGDIIHHGRPLDDPDGPLQRWTFTDITDSSFKWTGESSSDDGETWTVDQTMVGRRLEIDPTSV